MRNTKKIACIDTEVDVTNGKICDIGGISYQGTNEIAAFHSSSLEELRTCIGQNDYICGHNIIHHDIPCIEKALGQSLQEVQAIDTLFLSPLLFPKEPYHRLVKDDKLQIDDRNNPLTDAKKARDFIEQLGFTQDGYIIDPEVWEEAKKALQSAHGGSCHYRMCEHLIKTFELSNPKKKYQSDFELFVKESQIEDFITPRGETLFVSTIHKTKGKEFDNVFLLLSGFNPIHDEEKRQLYVALTRAKQHLTVHLHGNYLDNISCQHMKREHDTVQYEPENLLILHLGMKDVWLNDFAYRQSAIKKLTSGEMLKVHNGTCYNKNGKCVAKFSRDFKEKLLVYKRKGYKIVATRVNYMVYWCSEEQEKELLVVLPKLKLVKSEERKTPHRNAENHSGKEKNS